MRVPKDHPGGVWAAPQPRWQSLPRTREKGQIKSRSSSKEQHAKIWGVVCSSPKSDIHLGGIDCIFFLHNIEKKNTRETVRRVDVSPTQNDCQQYNTQREKQVLGKWFNIGDRSKKLHHTVTHVTKISLTVSTTRLCSH